MDHKRRRRKRSKERDRGRSSKKKKKTPELVATAKRWRKINKKKTRAYRHSQEIEEDHQKKNQSLSPQPCERGQRRRESRSSSPRSSKSYERGRRSRKVSNRERSNSRGDLKPPKFILDVTSSINSIESENKSDRKKVKKTPKYVKVGKFLIS